MTILEIIAAATAATNFIKAVASTIETAHEKGEVTDAEFEAALGRKAKSESRWDEAVNG